MQYINLNRDENIFTTFLNSFANYLPTLAPRHLRNSVDF